MVFTLGLLGNLAHLVGFEFLLGDKGDHFTAFLYGPDLKKAINQVYSSVTFCFSHLLLKFSLMCQSKMI